MAGERANEQTIGNHLITGMGGMVNMLEDYANGGLQLAAGDCETLNKQIERLYAVWEQQEKAHAAGR